jgi:predicted DNA-binding transcriptional regulator AlpA
MSHARATKKHRLRDAPLFVAPKRHPANDRLLTKEEVIARVRMSYSIIWGMMVAGRFPRSVYHGKRNAWYASEIDAWLDQRVRVKLKGD